MTTQFDEGTERAAIEDSSVYDEQMRFKRGRNSVKESLEILARAAERLAYWNKCYPQPEEYRTALDAVIEANEKAIAEIRQRGDWPISEEL